MLAVELDIMETDLKFSVDSYWRDEVSWLFPPCVMHTHTHIILCLLEQTGFLSGIVALCCESKQLLN
jgi:hypothetical protein